MFSVSSILGLMVCLSLLGDSGTMVSNGWGVLPRFFRVKPVTLGFESDQTSLLTAVLNPSTGKATVGKEDHPDKPEYQNSHTLYSICIMVQQVGAGSECRSHRSSVANMSMALCQSHQPNS